jgi:hypothetical protein
VSDIDKAREFYGAACAPPSAKGPDANMIAFESPTG